MIKFCLKHIEEVLEPDVRLYRAALRVLDGIGRHGLESENRTVKMQTSELQSKPVEFQNQKLQRG